MLRLVLSAGAEGISCLPFSFLPDSRWFSEAFLYPPFRARRRGDALAETHTHADGVVGHFEFTHRTKRGLKLRRDSKQFVVIEAKMYSPLRADVKRALFYDQAARTVACMAETVKRAGISVHDLESIGFYVLAPEDQIKHDVFTKQMTRTSVAEKVRHRILAYKDDAKHFSELETWFETTFDPLVQAIDLSCWSWERAVSAIVAAKPTEGCAIHEFYRRCLKYNRKPQQPNT